MDTIPISQLEKKEASSLSRTVRGVVTLIWPYSSSTRKAALLLAEPDFRLRKSKGQVRVQLAGAAAQEVARSKISSGDQVVLSLAGARWVDAAAGIVSTPGRSIDIELEFKRRITCEIFRDGALLKTLDVNDESRSESRSRSGSPTSPPVLARPLSTPYLGRINGLSTPASSAFHRRARVVSGELVDSPYDPFADDHAPVGHDRKRQRMSWEGDGRWTVNDNAPSPSKGDVRGDWIQDEDLQSPTKARIPSTPSSPSPEQPESPTVSRHPELQGTRHVPEATPQHKRYTQELVDLVSGDTEEEDFGQLVNQDSDEEMEDEDARAVSNALTSDSVFGGTKFSVFRDLPMDRSPPVQTLQTQTLFSQPQANQARDDVADAGLEFVNLPSSDPPAAVIEDPETPMTIEPLPLDTGIKDAHVVFIKEDARLEIDDEKEMNETEDDKQQETAQPPKMRLTSMPPPMLPILNTSALARSTTATDASPATSALPGSPKTPDLLPQHSGALPMPSPFPGEELDSYMDVSPSLLQNTFAAPPPADSSVMPDWMLQIGFGFGSQGFTRDSPPKQSLLPLGNDEAPSRAGLDTVPAALPHIAEEVEDHHALIDEHEIVESEGVPTRSSRYAKLAFDRDDQRDPINVIAFENSEAYAKAVTPEEQASRASERTILDAIAEEVAHSAHKVGPDEADSGVDESDSADEHERHEEYQDMRVDQDESAESEDHDSEAASITSSTHEVPQHDVSRTGDRLRSYDGSYERDDDESDDDEMEDDGAAAAALLASASAVKSQRPSTQEPIVIDLLDSDDETSEEEIDESSRAAPGVQTQQNEDTHESAAAERRSASARKLQHSDSPSARRPPIESDEQNAGPISYPSISQRSDMSFMSRVTRRGAAADTGSATNLEPGSQMILADAQSQFASPRLQVQDTFETESRVHDAQPTAPLSQEGDTSRIHDLTARSAHFAAVPGQPLHSEAANSLHLHDDLRQQAKDGEVGFVPSSPPGVASSNDPVSYPILPPPAMFDVADTHEERVQASHEIAPESHLPYTPEASQAQAQAQQPGAMVDNTQQQLTLPPTPHETQIDQSFQSYGEIEKPAPVDASASRQSVDLKTPATPAKAQLDSEKGTSVLSPWFNTQSAKKVVKIENGTTSARIETATTFRSDQVYSGDTKSHQEAVAARSSPSQADVSKVHNIVSQLVFPEFSFSQSQATQARGLLTNLSYYTPVGALFSCIRIPSSNSQSYNDGCADVIAVVSKASTKPLRAEKGQRDYYTTLSITDEKFWPRTIRVQVFRPWKRALPEAEKGDIVLLRAFEVFPAKGNVGVGLKSAESAAWCVWRFKEDKSGVDPVADDARPWTKRDRATVAESEQMNGPPVELGDQERRYARDLREWWLSIKDQTMSGNPRSAL